ncbi:FadR/GntR family transcriptional regulator [Pseudonocardia acaciae]|uniref:FadR/GntR family transcriptional regulator n=1 Tax=Pseudonocardia acaciae TaxID=551276 RepID=UPI000562498C|nr:FCD domain-containing protein [Pseudonocardia acaciae]
MRRYPLAEQAAELLLARVTDGRLAIGGRLPGETALAAELGVGRSTVREAIRELAGRGVLESRQGAGVFVVAAEPAEDWDAVLRRSRIADVVEGRVAVEVEAARLAARRRTPNDLRTLRRRLADRAEAGGDAAFVDADLRFHRAVVAAAHNPVIAEMFASFAPRIRRAMLDFLAARRPGAARPDAADAHRAIAEAVRDRDPDRAAAVSRAHLDQLLAAVTDPP